jgi:hypothetical protein
VRYAVANTPYLIKWLGLCIILITHPKIKKYFDCAKRETVRRAKKKEQSAEWKSAKG